MRVENLSLKAFKEDRQLCARASILVALLVIAVLGVALAYTSTPCYHFLVSQQGIVSSVAVGVGLVALMVFWNKSEPTTSKTKTPTPKSVTSNGRSEPRLTVSRSSSPPIAPALNVSSTVAAPFQPPAHVAFQQLVVPPLLQRALGLKWDVVEAAISDGEKPFISYIESAEMPFVHARLKVPESVLPFYEPGKGYKAFLVDHDLNITVIDYDRDRSVIGQYPSHYKVLTLVPNFNALPVAMGDLEIGLMPEAFTEASLQVLSCDDEADLERRISARCLPPNVAIFYRFEGKVKVKICGDKVVDQTFDTLKQAEDYVRDTLKNCKSLLIRQRDLKVDWEDDYVDFPALMNEDEIRRVFDQLSIRGQIVIQNRASRKFELWGRPKGDGPAEKQEELAAAPQKYSFESLKNTRNVQLNNWVVVYYKPSNYQIPHLTRAQALEIASQLSSDSVFQYNEIDMTGRCYGNRKGEVHPSSRNWVHIVDISKAARCFLADPELRFETEDVTNWYPIKRVLPIPSSAVDRLEELSREPLTIVAYYEEGSTKETSGYGALVVDREGRVSRIASQRSLRALNYALQKVQNHTLIELRKQMMMSCLLLGLNFLNSDAPPRDKPLPQLFDDERVLFRRAFEIGLIPKGHCLFYQTITGNMKVMGYLLNEPFFDKEISDAAALESMRKQHRRYEIQLEKRNMGFYAFGAHIHWELTDTVKPTIELSVKGDFNEAGVLASKIPNALDYFIVKRSGKFQLYTKAGKQSEAVTEDELVQSAGAGKRWYPKFPQARDVLTSFDKLKVTRTPPENPDHLPSLTTEKAYELIFGIRDPSFGFYYHDKNRDKVLLLQISEEHELGEGETVAQHRARRSPDVVEVYLSEARNES